MIKVGRALISVFDKTDVISLAKFLDAIGVDIISTGQTYATLRDAGINAVEVSDCTNFPEIMDGRVKTLHPKIHGGILGDRILHAQEMLQHQITGIDLVIVNLYPFSETAKSGCTDTETIAQIDIGGVTLIRAAAKNFRYVTVITDINDYSLLKKELDNNAGTVSLNFRKAMAAKAFVAVAKYDIDIMNWFDSTQTHHLPERFVIHGAAVQTVRSGENPHQKSAFYSNEYDEYPLKKLNGKDLSYNNILDTESALRLCWEFSEPICVIVKHNNPCGVASDSSILTAYKKAFASDTLSSFGGVVAINREVSIQLAEVLASTFLEVVVAPSFTAEALQILQQKPNLRLLITPQLSLLSRYEFRSVFGGFLLQEYDNHVIDPSTLQIKTQREPSKSEMSDLIFAWRVSKHVKSNAVVLARDGTTLGIGAGQMSRIDSTNLAIKKCNDLQGSVMASDGFFPFPDSVEVAASVGVTAIIQPGGSIRDQEIIEKASELGISMVFTGVRCFKH